jgi:hypothetical protein
VVLVRVLLLQHLAERDEPSRSLSDFKISSNRPHALSRMVAADGSQRTEVSLKEIEQLGGLLQSARELGKVAAELSVLPVLVVRRQVLHPRVHTQVVVVVEGTRWRDRVASSAPDKGGPGGPDLSRISAPAPAVNFAPEPPPSPPLYSLVQPSHGSTCVPSCIGSVAV